MCDHNPNVWGWRVNTGVGMIKVFWGLVIEDDLEMCQFLLVFLKCPALQFIHCLAHAECMDHRLSFNCVLVMNQVKALILIWFELTTEQIFPLTAGFPPPSRCELLSQFITFHETVP